MIGNNNKKVMCSYLSYSVIICWFHFFFPLWIYFPVGLKDIALALTSVSRHLAMYIIIFLDK